MKDEYQRANLHREARVMAILRHPNIVRLYETLKVHTALSLSLSLSLSVKVTKHSTIPYDMYLYFPSCAIFDFKKCRDLEIRVRGHSRLLKVAPFYRLGVVSY